MATSSIRSVCESLLKKARQRHKSDKPEQVLIVTSNQQLVIQFIRKYHMVPIPTLGIYVGYCDETKLFVCNPLRMTSTEMSIIQRPLLHLLSGISMIVYVAYNPRPLPPVGFKIYTTEDIERNTVPYSFYDRHGLQPLKRANAMVHIKNIQNWVHHHQPSQGTLAPNLEHHILSRIFSLSINKRRTVCF